MSMSFTDEQRRVADNLARREAERAVKHLSHALMSGHNAAIFEALRRLEEMGTGTKNKRSTVDVDPIELVVHAKDPALNVDDETALEHAHRILLPAGGELCYMNTVAAREPKTTHFVLRSTYTRDIRITREQLKNGTYQYKVVNPECLVPPSGRVVGYRVRGAGPNAGLLPREC